jgi:hypothetical protein
VKTRRLSPLTNYSSCVQKAVTAYLETLALPVEGAKCGQDLDLALSAGERRRARSRAACALLRGRSGALQGVAAATLLQSALLQP